MGFALVASALALPAPTENNNSKSAEVDPQVMKHLLSDGFFDADGQARVTPQPSPASSSIYMAPTSIASDTKGQ